MNDHSFAGPDFRLVLIENGAEPPVNTSPDIVVRSPSKTGIAIQRVFVDTGDRLDDLDGQRKLAGCRTLSES